MDTFSILLVLKDRTSYTRRLMNKWNSENFPFKILIADGGKDLETQNWLSNKSNFENLDYEYLRYPFDESLQNFYAKMADAVMKIKTSTVCLMDNDDFIDIEGIKKCLEILKDSTYSSARGLMQDTTGRNMYADYPNSIIANTATDRMIEQTKHFHGNWHNVTRSNHIESQWRMIEVVSPNNFRITEQITGYLNTIWGNSYRGNFPWMIHEHSPRIETQYGSLGDHFPDQRTWIECSHAPEAWLQEFNKMTEVVSAAISHHDKIPIDEALKIFRESYHFKLPHLKDLLNNRINQAYELGYDYNRINQMFKIMQECKI